MIRTLTAVWLLCLPAAALAQQATSAPGLPRGDAAMAAGWLHSAIDSAVTAPPSFRGRDWTHDRATFGAGAGFYWTQHLKTELWVEASNDTEIWDTRIINENGAEVVRGVEHMVSDVRLSFAQFYQFRENEWVHPSVGAGVTIRRRTNVSEYAPAYVFSDRGGTPRVIRPAERIGPETRTEATGFLALAVKTYVSRRAFLRTDAQVEFRNGLEDVNARVGFGFDF
jgi:hypothetical protein